MTVEIAGILTLAVALFGMFCGPSFIVAAFFLATLLGSAAAFILESVGGLTISPAHFLLGIVALKLLIDKTILQRTIRAMHPVARVFGCCWPSSMASPRPSSWRAYSQGRPGSFRFAFISTR